MIAAALALGCGAEPEATAKPQGCGLALSPDAALEAVAEKWVADWSAALPECDIRIEEGGVPLYAADELVNPNTGNLTCAQTEAQYTESGRFLGALEIRIDMTPPTRCAAWGYHVGHEIAHALGVRGHVEGDESLLSDGMKTGREYTVDAVSVAYARERLGLIPPLF